MNSAAKKPGISLIDNVIIGIDRAIRTVSPGSVSASRVSPASVLHNQNSAIDESDLIDKTTQLHISGLMRINHTGEVCAQALYQGQALTAKDPLVKQSMQESADEEEDHLAWCEERLSELNSQPSYLNPLFYGLSFSIGALAGIAGDKWSLGFIAATEEQVCAHLQSHLEEIPEADKKSRAILEQMLIDEKEHGEKALKAGGVDFNQTYKNIMTALSKIMTRTTYKI